MKKQIPNLLTLSNLFFGCLALSFAFSNELAYASYFVFLGMIADFLDGFFARILKVSQPIGTQLDSLADMVTFGVVPGVIIYKLLQESLIGMEIHDFTAFVMTNSAYLIPLASAYRLAKFNLDDKQETYFIGMPTPANALFIISLPLIIEYHNLDDINNIIINYKTLIFISVVSSVLLNANIKMFSLKFKNYHFASNIYRYLLLLSGLLGFLFFQFLSIPLIILCYILFSIMDGKK